MVWLNRLDKKFWQEQTQIQHAHMSNRSVDIFGKAQESSEKFDYFVCGVAGAFFAYIGEHYSPQKLEFDVSILEPISLLLLALAFFVGLKQIEMAIAIKRLNFELLHEAEVAGNLTKILATGIGPYYNEESGDIFNRSSAESQRISSLKRRDEIQPMLAAKIKKRKILYRTRDILLILGFLTVFAAKVLQPYASAN